jgi:hypothetical protein
MLALKHNFGVYLVAGSLISLIHLALGVEWNPPQKLEGVVLRLWGTEEHISWGNLNPTDTLTKYRDHCNDLTCVSKDWEMDTEVVVNTQDWRRKLVIKMVESKFTDAKNGTATHLIEALADLVSREPFVTSSTDHWDQNTEQASCPPGNSNYCWSKSPTVVDCTCCNSVSWPDC